MGLDFAAVVLCLRHALRVIGAAQAVLLVRPMILTSVVLLGFLHFVVPKTRVFSQVSTVVLLLHAVAANLHVRRDFKLIVVLL